MKENCKPTDQNPDELDFGAVVLTTAARALAIPSIEVISALLAKLRAVVPNLDARRTDTLLGLFNSASMGSPGVSYSDLPEKARELFLTSIREGNPNRDVELAVNQVLMTALMVPLGSVFISPKAALALRPEAIHSALKRACLEKTDTNSGGFDVV
jgi:hypothetical protein